MVKFLDASCTQRKMTNYCRGLEAPCSNLNFARYDSENKVWKCYSQVDDRDQTQIKACIGENGERILCQKGQSGKACERNQEIVDIINVGCPKGEHQGQSWVIWVSKLIVK